MTESQFKQKLGKNILLLNGVLVLVFLLSLIFKGFKPYEVKQLLALLAPIHTLYVSAVVKYIVNYRPQPDTVSEPIPQMLSQISTWLIWTHLILLIVLITVQAFVRFLHFDTLMIILTIIETGFGAYIGVFMERLFKEQTPAA